MDEVYPESQSNFLESVLTRFRRARYLQAKEVLEFGEDIESKNELFNAHDVIYYRQKQAVLKELAAAEVDPGFVFKSRQTPV